MKAFFGYLVVFTTFIAFSNALKPPPYKDEFATCCKEKSVSNSCQQFCSFEFNPKEVIAAFKTGVCNVETDSAPYYQCLQNSKNMTSCCNDLGAATSKKPQHCIDLCDGSTTIKYDAKYSLCEPVQGIIMSCGIDSYSDESKMVHKSGNVVSPTMVPDYTVYPSDYKYLIYGHISCEDGQPVGDNAQAILMEYDPVTFNDEIARVNIVRNEFTILAPADRENDFPTSEFEIYLVFENICNYWRSHKSGVVLSQLNVSYVLLDTWLNRYAYVPSPFPEIAAAFSRSQFRDCWLRVNAGQTEGCDFDEYLDYKKQAEKFQVVG